jgi:hypothetical protein
MGVAMVLLGWPVFTVDNGVPPEPHGLNMTIGH